MKYIKDCLRHPLVVTLASVGLGGFGLHVLQVSNSKAVALQNKRFQILEEVVAYRTQAYNTLRFVDVFACQLRNHKLSKSEQAVREVEMQGELNKTFDLEDKARINLAIYFPTPQSAISFEDVTSSYHKALDAGMARVNMRAPCDTEWLKPYYTSIHENTVKVIVSMKPALPIPSHIIGKCN